MANPLVAQGTLNRLRASVVWASFPSLNVTASYLGKEGISLSFDGDATTTIDTMTGAVQSPEPYQRVTFSIHLLKTQALAAAFKAQIESSTLLGNATFRPDAVSLPPYQLSNCAINTVNPLKFDGTDAGWVLMGRGFYIINNSLWNL